MIKACSGRQFSSWGCTEPEAPRNLRGGGCAEPEAVGNCHPGGAQSLRRPAILVNGVHKKRSVPEAVGNYTVHRTCDTHQF